MTTPEATPGSPPAAAPYDAGAKQKREAKTSRIPIKVVAEIGRASCRERG